METNTEKEKIEYLNDFYSENYDQEQAIEKFDYLTSNQRAKRTTLNHIRKCHKAHRLGSLLNRLDPIGFNLTEIPNG